jgi:hypothetical protein
MIFGGKLVPVTVTRDSDRKFALRGAIRETRGDSQKRVGRFDYTATIDKPTKKIFVYADPTGYPNRFAETGVCRIITK